MTRFSAVAQMATFSDSSRGNQMSIDRDQGLRKPYFASTD
jgi:hypothetical protein